VPVDGRYELLFAGNSLGRLEEPPSISPFTWQIDGGPEHRGADAEPVPADIPGAPEGASILGALELTAGDHTFRLKLTSRRAQPDTHYALWIDALALRRAE